MLDKSLFQAVLIDLGMQRMQDAVDNPWAETPWAGQLERPGAESQPLAPQQTLADVFEEEGGSLLILGEPGSGKTTSMLELTRGLLARAEDDPLRPVPVVFNLSAWTAPYTALDDWLAAELERALPDPQEDRPGLAGREPPAAPAGWAGRVGCSAPGGLRGGHQPFHARPVGGHGGVLPPAGVH